MSSSSSSMEEKRSSATSDGASVGSQESSSSTHSTSAGVAQILSPRYLEKHSSKKELVTRLRTIVQVVGNDENNIEPDDTQEFPGLAALCQTLHSFIDNSDKQVRLYTVSACMELFAIYAPDAPWTTQQTLDIFRQTIRQLVNLAHTTSPSQVHFQDYMRILELLATVKIGVLLVDLYKEEDCKEQCQQVLCEFFRTLLQSIRLDHPAKCQDMIVAIICGCLEEFYEGMVPPPVPLLDELLICIGQGSTVLVVNPQLATEHQQKQTGKQSKRSDKHQNNVKSTATPLQVEQANPSYQVAAAVIRKSTERLSSPIANLLNGLLNHDARMMEETCLSTTPIHGISSKPQPQNQLDSSQGDVWCVIYELHRVSPSILTTVIGTLVNFLCVPEHEQRQWVVQLLGKIFCASPKFARRFRPCFRDWLERSKDKNLEIRLNMTTFLLHILSLKVTSDDEAFVADEAQPVLRDMLEGDPHVEVRRKVLHGVCDKAYRVNPTAKQLQLDLWLAVGTRCDSKFKPERKDALTGLVQTFFKQFMLRQTRPVQEHDCAIDIVLSVLNGPEDRSALTEDIERRYLWIPSKLFECVHWRDDNELTSRIWQLVDDLLLGSEIPHMNKSLPATARAVGLALVVDSLDGNAQAWMGVLQKQRAQLQQAMSHYLNLRSEIKNFPSGSEGALTADAKALDALERVGTMTSLSTLPGERNPILEQFHGAKDKHIFRILSTISTPTHSTKSRLRALDDLPKRVKSLGEKTVAWMKSVVRQCPMGDFMNQEVIHTCITLAHGSGMREDWGSCEKFLRCVFLASEYFPEICAAPTSFQLLSELFGECRSINDAASLDVVSMLGSILANAAPATGQSTSLDDEMRKQLLNLCYRDGTPEQARHAVKTMASLIHPEQHGGFTQDNMSAFEPLLHALTSPSRLTTSSRSERLVSILAALGELADQAPKVLESSRGQKAVAFALDRVLLRRGSVATLDNGDEEETTTPRVQSSSSRRSSGARNHQSPGIEVSVLEDKALSLSCRTLCAAIDFLGSYIRASVLANPSAMKKGFEETIERVFDVLCQILRDKGMPPSGEDRRECNMRQDRAALRQYSAVQLLRLCDTRLGLDQKFLSPLRWHVLASVFLDDERAVRDHVLSELALMLTCNGKFGKCNWTNRIIAPRLRFVAFVAFCTDGDHGNQHARANGNAANVGKRSSSTKANAAECITEMRKMFELAATQASANGAEEEQRFERAIKPSIMPEYVVPYVFHLLCFRRETPSASMQDGDGMEGDEAGHRMLRKRLKWVFDPLVHSLGDTADNISLLLRMSEIVAKNFEPMGFTSSGVDEDDGDHPGLGSTNASNEAIKLKVVCSAAREVLLSFVKKDVNLATYPGLIQIPGNLFKRGTSKKRSRLDNEKRSPSTTEAPLNDEAPSPLNSSLPSSPPGFSEDVESPTSRGAPDQSRRLSRSLRSNTESAGVLLEEPDLRRNPRLSPLSKKRLTSDFRVHFSPELTIRSIPASAERDFEDPSPFQKGTYPADQRSPGVLLSSGEKTRGSTPPSALRSTRFSASTSLAMEVSKSDSSKSSEDKSTVHSVNESFVSEDGTKSKVSVESGTENNASNAGGRVLCRSQKRVSLDLELENSKRRRVPLQIKVVRKSDNAAKSPKRRRGSRRQRKAADEDFDFEASGKTIA